MKKKRVKLEIKNSQMCLVIFEIMNKLCEYFEYDFIAKVTLSKKICFEEIEFYSKMPVLKRKKLDEDHDQANEMANLSFNNKIIYFPTEHNNIKENVNPIPEEKSIYKNKLSKTKYKEKDNDKDKEKDIIEHNYNKVTPKEEEGKNSQIDDISYSDKKRSLNSDKSTNQSSSKFSPQFKNEVLIKFSAFR